MKSYRYCDASQSFRLQEESSIPTAGAGEAIVKVLRAGICATDHQILQGYKGGFKGTLGHELVGVVVSVDPSCETSIRVGDRVAPELNLPCDKCDFCKSGDSVLRRNHCKQREVLGIVNSSQGAFAEYLRYPAEFLYKIPKSIPVEVAAFVEPFAAAYRIVEQGVITKSAQKVAVVGDGKLGLLIALVLSLSLPKECRIYLFGRHQDKLDIVKHLVAETIVVDDTTEESYNCMFDACVAATGSIRGLELAVTIVKPLGNLILKSTCSARDTGDLLTTVNNAIVVKEIVVQGSRCGPFAEAISLMDRELESVRPVLQRMISKTFPFSDMDEALNYSKGKGILKVQVVMAES